MKESIKKIQELAEKHHIKPYEIGKKTSVSTNTASSILKNTHKNPKTKTVQIILDYLLEFENKNYLSQDWHVENQIKHVGKYVKEPASEYLKIAVPYYDIEFAAGFEDFSQNLTTQPTSYITHPFFNGCDYVIRASGQSMAKIIKHGDAIGIVKINSWQEFLPFGEIYAIVTKDNYRMIKVITAGKTDNTFTLISKPTDNKKEEFPPQQINKTQILHIFKVQASSYLF